MTGKPGSPRGLAKLYIEQLRQVLPAYDWPLKRALSIVYCTARFGASPNNYHDFDFANLRDSERGEYLTYRSHQRLIDRGNLIHAVENVRDKARFSLFFAEYTGRRSLPLTEGTLEEATEFFRSCATGCLLKPRRGSQGNDVIPLNLADFSQGGRVQRIYDEIDQDPGTWLLEERLVQNGEMTEWFGAGLAPIRVVTGVSPRGVAEALWAAITMGRGEDAVNYHLGGIMAPIDVHTGKLLGPAIDESGETYQTHPISGAVISEVTIPSWQETLALCRQAAAKNPDVRFCGWDVGMTERGPVLIEGNHDPGTYAMWQRSIYRERLGGLLPRLEVTLGDLF